MAQKPYVFSKASKRKLLESLEMFYQQQVFEWQIFKKLYNVENPDRKQKTKVRNMDRRYRTRIKSAEILLFSLESPLLQNVKQSPSIRRTFETYAGVNGDAKD